MTLCAYSSVAYIVCVLDSEGHRMGLVSLMSVRHVILVSAKKYVHPSYL